MTVMRSIKATGWAAAAAGAMLAVAACSPSAPETAPTPTGASAPASSASTLTASPGPTASPGTSATVGKIVAGFPAKLLPVMPGATVISSSFDRNATPATAALVASIPAPAAAVVEFYTQQLQAQGFKAVPGDAVGAVASKDFVRNDTETVNVAVVEAAGVSTFTIGANVAAESAQ